MTGAPPGDTAPALTWVIFRKELLDIMRDRRALFFAFLVPLGLYPVLFLAFSAVSRRSEPAIALKVGFSGDYQRFVPYLRNAGVVVDEVSLLPEAVRRGDLALFLQFGPPAGGLDAPPPPEAAGTERVTLYYASMSPSSEEARRRVQDGLEAYRSHLLEERFAFRGTVLAADLPVEAIDISSPEERSGALLARLLPLVLVLILLSGGSFAAIDLIAGEKERGTLETLYI